jgi:alanyl-tRNA synthetase
MTNDQPRLYYADPHLREFDGTVTRVEARGDRSAIWLDRSAFYPTSGGQPFDTGTLGGRRVLEVADENDDVVHLVESGGAARVSDRVHGEIDWDRRFDHMQHHTGQHVLSAAIVRRCRVPTLSFHLGHDVCTIDVARELSPDELIAAEDAANRVVGENRPVTIRYATADEAATLGLRKPSQRQGTLRLIDVADFDLSACGGTHVRATGSIGGIVVTAWERFKGGQRISFVCGGRAVCAHRLLRDTVTASVRLLSVLPTDLPAAIGRLQSEQRARDRAAETLQRELATFRAASLADAAEPFGSARWVFKAIDTNANGLKTLAQAVVSKPGLMAVLVSMTAPVLLVVARSPDVAHACDSLVKSIAAEFGGRGGGRPDLAQAGALAASPDAVLARARALAANAPAR